MPAIVTVVGILLTIIFLLLANFDKSKLPHFSTIERLYLPHKTSKPFTRGVNDIQNSIAFYQTLYHQLQNLEQYPEGLERGRGILVTWVADALERASRTPGKSILSVEQYSKEALLAFVQRQQDEVTEQFEAYYSRRQKGGPRERFPNRDSAIKWLKETAPLQLVDGAWLGHIHKITTPFKLRAVSKGLWQILSEELGDGDRKKHHVYVYQELLKSIGHVPQCPTSPEFLQSQHSADNIQSWRAAVAQLLIGSIPDESLPELLGFNLCFEGVQLDTLIIATELREVGIDPYYFVLHISIDNMASGHKAMAAECVNQYLDHIRDSEGVQAMDHAWKRVQAGFVFCDDVNSSLSSDPPILVSHTDLEVELLDVFASKVNAARGVHCTSKARIGSRTMVDWLNPVLFRSPEWQQDFMRNLTDARPWVYKSDSQKSRLVHELRWGGRMFGCFTDRELDILERWIDTLHPFPHTTPHSSSVSDGKRQFNMRNVGFISQQDIDLPHPGHQHPPDILPGWSNGSPKPSPKQFKISNLLPLWFTHTCLLEGLVYAPAITTSETGCAVIRILRAQKGFAKEGPVAAGIDGMKRTDSSGIVEMGQELMKRLGLLEPSSIMDVLQVYPSDFANRMLYYAMVPAANLPLLLGILLAFVELQELVAVSDLLSPEHSDKLTDIALRERECLQFCQTELAQQPAKYVMFCTGYQIGRKNVKFCLDEE
ncbi:hypothetical protein BDV25DRAFT_135038 [Aspergillus avenaceus]|uniref:Uncharacterized protein n=1 Tax=Aspergillus avenaceus TaxID=36643 RepID=A0A5N6UAQ1_ASPAV|nr:hypothetical protein BDV25DRAFT_135038 [Aspergillus avenaceus]